MKKLQKASELLWLMGIVFVALGVAICSKADLGVSMIAAPAFVIHEALVPLWQGLSVGVTEYIIQGLLLLVLCVAVRRFNWRYLLAFAVAVLYGYVLDFFLWVLSGVSFDAVWLRFVMLLLGDAVTAFGVACFFRTYMPLQVYELFVAELADRFGLPLEKIKLGFDMSLLALSLLLAFTLFGDIKSLDLTTVWYTSFHSIGSGTLITVAINSPLIAFMGKIVDRVLGKDAAFPRMEKLLKRN